MTGSEKNKMTKYVFVTGEWMFFIYPQNKRLRPAKTIL